MCFSATSSFIAGAALTATGFLCIAKVKQREQLLFAAIPFLFAIQQFIEGLLWLFITDTPNYIILKRNLAILFLFIAESVWPIWIPLSLMLLEKNRERQFLLLFFLFIGEIVAIYLAFGIATYNVAVDVVMHHIVYFQHDKPASNFLIKAPYLIATITPFFISSVKYMKLIGLSILTTYLLTRLLFFDQFFLSLWCFLAAIVSLLTYIVMHTIKMEYLCKNSDSKTI